MRTAIIALVLLIFVGINFAQLNIKRCPSSPEARPTAASPVPAVEEIKATPTSVVEAVKPSGPTAVEAFKPPKAIIAEAAEALTRAEAEAPTEDITSKITIRKTTGEKPQTILEVNKVEAVTKIVTVVEATGLYAKIGAEKVKVEVLPDAAHLIARIATFGGEVQTIELIEENNKPIYDITTKSSGMLFGLIPATYETKLKIDAETGKVESATKPWWSSLVFGAVKEFAPGVPHKGQAVPAAGEKEKPVKPLKQQVAERAKGPEPTFVVEAQKRVAEVPANQTKGMKFTIPLELEPINIKSVEGAPL